MNTHTNYQTIEYNGHPAFVLVPWDQFNKLRPVLDAENSLSTGIPQEVVEAHVLNNTPIVRAWREYLGITQAELASRMGVSQSAVAKFERLDANLRFATRKNIASALGLNPVQLDV